MTEKSFEIKAYSKSEMAALYHVSVSTFIKWIHPHNVLTPERWECKIFTPAEVKVIIEKIGEP